MIGDRSETARLPHSISRDSALFTRIEELHLWAVTQGLSGARSGSIFEGFCARLSEGGVPLRRGFAGMRTLHPKWGGYTYLWHRERETVDIRLVEG